MRFSMPSRPMIAGGTLKVLAAVAVLASGALSAGAADKSKDPAKPLPEDVVAAWKKAGGAATFSTRTNLATWTRCLSRQWPATCQPSR